MTDDTAPATSTTPPPPEPAAPARARRAARWLRRLGWAVTGLLLFAVALVAGVWIWMGSGQSLALALAQAARYMPEGMTLESEDVSGSLRAGGHIGRLRWQSPTLSVEVQDATLGWTLQALLHRRVQVGEVHAARVEIAPRGPKPADDNKPIEPLQQLVLPVEIDLPFQVDTLRWAGPPEARVSNLAGHYRYQGGEHRLEIHGVDYADGHYTALAKLQAAAPMALDARVDATVRAPLGDDRHLDVRAEATAKGTLAGEQARLQVQAKVAPAEQAPDQPMQADVKAEVAPWEKQPLLQADAVLQQLDLARLLPQAPLTDLSGEVHLGPDPAVGALAWTARIDLRNGQPGPWDEARLPLDRIQAEARYDGAQLVLPQAVLQRGAGRVQASGNWRPGAEPWQANLTVQKLALGDLHTQLAGAPIDGEVKVEQMAGGRIDFAADLQAKGGTGGAGVKARKDDLLAGLQLRRVKAQGQWQDEMLTLRQLRLEAAGALIEGEAQAKPGAQSGKGQLKVQLPGLQADIKADMAPAKGQGDLKAQLSDTAALQRWIESLPGLSKVFAGLTLQGTAKLDASWTGGWQTLQQRLSAPDQPLARGTAEPTVRAQLDVPRLGTRDKSTPAPGAWELRNLRAELAGTLADARLTLAGDARSGLQELALSLQGGGGVKGPGQWRVHLATLDARLQPDARRRQGAPWRVQLQQPLDATVSSQKNNLQADLQASGVRLTGPEPGTVQLNWEPTRLVSKGGAVRLQSKGRLGGVPLAWAQALGPGTLQEMGVGGDVVFDGNWDIDAGDRLQAKIQVRRASGDIRVQAGEASMVRRVRSTGTGMPSEIKTDLSDKGLDASGSTPAGLRQAQLDIEAQGEDLRASLVWDSERAGVIKADMATRLARAGDGWRWPDDAPLTGQVDARMPKLGVWSILAPPGWRVGGTVDARMSLSGSRNDPRWNGTLSGDDLSLRAAVEGIDLRNGKLRATLDGQRLTLQEFSMQGGPGSTVRIPGRSGNLSTESSEQAANGGSVRLSGTAAWGQGGGSGIAMDMRGDIRRLRVLARADRQVTLSGDMQATLAQGKLTVRSKLTTDRGVIILPPSTAPSLGSDVKIRSAARDKAAAEAAARKAEQDARREAREEKAQIQQVQTAQPPDILVSLDMGKDFAVQGHGITTRLGGQLDIRVTRTGAPPNVTGEIQTVAGIYRAYGQQLDVETGIARFNGPADNPQLDIVALRPNILQRAGVRITGTANSPRVTLYSEPPLADAETLSWIMLGRASASSGGEALLMQQAALAVLGSMGDGGGGNMAQKIGLDEIGIKGPGDNGDARDSAITLGKRLSKDFYVTYERSLAGAMGTLFMFYDLTERLTLRGEAGEHYGADLIYTIKYD